MDYRKNISDDSSYYQPNFVIVSGYNHNYKFYYKNTFGDIIPIYGSVTKLTSVIDFSISKYNNYLRKWEDTLYVLAILIWSLIIEVLNNVVYNTYLIINEIVYQFNDLPYKFKLLNEKINIFNTLVKDNKLKKFWYLNLKLEVKEKILKINNFLKLSLIVFSKFYLLFLVTFSIIGLYVTKNNTTFNTNSNTSFTQRFIDKNLIKYNLYYKDVASYNLVPLSILVENNNLDKNFNSSIIEYNVNPQDTIDSIAEMYGLKPETIIINNNLKNDILPEKIYIPWADSYIYKAETDTKLEDLARIYKIDASSIYRQNETTIDQSTQTFKAGSLVIIPTNDFVSIQENNIEEEKRIANIKKAKEEALKNNKIQNNLRTTNTYTYKNTFSNERSLGFIFPTVFAGTYTSRCLQPGHIACDFANSTEPPIFAVSSGVVVTKSYEAGGYGNYVIIDHGNGVKTLYAHMKDVYVNLNQEVLQGQSIGQMGCVGNCSGTHLHFEVIYNGVKQNPVPYLASIP